MWIFIAVGVGVLALAHTAPAPFLFDAIAGSRAVWHMPKRTPPSQSAIGTTLVWPGRVEAW